MPLEIRKIQSRHSYKIGDKMKVKGKSLVVIAIGESIAGDALGGLNEDMGHFQNADRNFYSCVALAALPQWEASVAAKKAAQDAEDAPARALIRGKKILPNGDVPAIKVHEWPVVLRNNSGRRLMIGAREYDWRCCYRSPAGNLYFDGSFSGFWVD